MEKVKIILYGVGAIGSMVAKSILKKDGVEIVGALDVAKDKVGKDLGKVLGLRRELGILVMRNVKSLIAETKPHIAVHTTSSFLRDTYPQLASVVKHGVNVVSTCEELSYPYMSEPKLAQRLDTLAKKNDVTLLGTGINPGFLMDTLVIALTAPCQRIDKIEATRVMNAATRRVPFQKKIGAGLTIEKFKRKIERKEITGHVGLEQSTVMIADALAWKLDRIVAETVRPVIAKKNIASHDIRVRAGDVAGLKQRARGVKNGKDVITLDFRAYIGAEKEYDAINIQGVPPINQKIQPCVHGDIGTIAMVANAIPKVINAPAGLLTMKDLPLPSAAVEEMTKYIRD